jgi:hypothetical protein
LKEGSQLGIELISLACPGSGIPVAVATDLEHYRSSTWAIYLPKNLALGYVACYTGSVKREVELGDESSFSGAAILQALAHNYRYGFDIMDVTDSPAVPFIPR